MKPILACSNTRPIKVRLGGSGEVRSRDPPPAVRCHQSAVNSQRRGNVTAIHFWWVESRRSNERHIHIGRRVGLFHHDIDWAPSIFQTRVNNKEPMGQNYGGHTLHYPASTQLNNPNSLKLLSESSDDGDDDVDYHRRYGPDGRAETGGFVPIDKMPAWLLCRICLADHLELRLWKALRDMCATYALKPPPPPLSTTPWSSHWLPHNKPGSGVGGVRGVRDVGGVVFALDDCYLCAIPSRFWIPTSNPVKFDPVPLQY